MGDELLSILSDSILPAAERLTPNQMVLPRARGKSPFGAYPPIEDTSLYGTGVNLETSKVGGYGSHRRIVEWAFGVAGTAELALDGSRYKVERGDIAVIPSGISHLERAPTAKDNFHLLWVAAKLDAKQIQIHSSTYAGSNRFQLISGASMSEREDLCRLMSRSADETLTPRKGSNALIRAMIIQAVIEFIRHLEEHGVGFSTPQQRSSMLDIAKSYIHSHFAERLTLEEIASAVFLSPNYFSSVFAQATGTTVFDYVNKIRMEEAKRLLQETRLPVNEVAQQAGFNTASHFTRVFTQDTGLSPRAFRRELVKKSLMQS